MGISKDGAAVARSSSARTRAAARALAVAIVAIAAGLAAAPARADGFTDTELSACAADAYLEGALAKPGSLDDADYRELARVDDAASGVQAVALERRRDHAVVVAYAGTSSGEPVDLLADLGIAAADLRYVVTDAAHGIVELAVSKGWMPRRRAAAARTALVGPHRLPKGRARAARWRAEAARVRAAGFDPTRATEAQLAVARRFLEQVLAMKTLDGRPIGVADVVVTGHSLGGFLVQIVAAERGARGVTFNAPGAQHYQPALHSAIIRNLIRRHDVVGTFSEHIGTTEAWDDVPFKGGEGESKVYLVRNHSIDAFHATLEQAGA